MQILQNNRNQFSWKGLERKEFTTTNVRYGIHNKAKSITTTASILVTYGKHKDKQKIGIQCFLGKRTLQAIYHVANFRLHV